MKDIKDFINEASQEEYRVSFLGTQDKEGVPFTVTILVDKQNVKAWEKYLEDQLGDTIFHADGNNIEL